MIRNRALPIAFPFLKQPGIFPTILPYFGAVQNSDAQRGRKAGAGA